MKYISLCVILALLSISTPFSLSQTPEPTVTDPSFILRDGTPVRLRLGRNLSSADAKTGETVDFEVLEEIKIGDIVVIPREGIALATVTHAKPKGRMGKGGKLDITIDSVRLVSGEKAA